MQEAKKPETNTIRDLNKRHHSGGRRGAPLGNKNAVGNKGGGAPEGNKNAEKHGMYSAENKREQLRRKETIARVKLMHELDKQCSEFANSVIFQVD